MQKLQDIKTLHFHFRKLNEEEGALHPPVEGTKEELR